MTNSNRQLVAFPFPPHVARYLFYQLKNEAITTEDALTKTLDISLYSVHGQMLRMLFKKANVPQLVDVKEGYRFYVSIPRQVRKQSPLYDDGIHTDLFIPKEVLNFIIDFYTREFENDLVVFICGFVKGYGEGAIHKGIVEYMKTYGIEESKSEYERLRKIYYRHNHPLKSSVYAKKKSIISKMDSKTKSKDLINRKIKKY